VLLSVTPIDNATWTAVANACWLHLTEANQSGSGSPTVVFTFDANPGATRVGTITLAGQTLTITQAGSTYIPASPLTPLVSTGLNGPRGVAVSSMGNVYIADTFDSAIKEWSVTGDTVTTLVSTGLNTPIGIAVDLGGNVYIADTVNNAIKEWSATDNTVTTLVSAGLDYPQGVAVDAADNVYIADTFNNVVKEWSGPTNILTTLVSMGLSGPLGVAVNAKGDVYIADTFHNQIEEWTLPWGFVTTPVSCWPYYPYGVAVDGSGNLYIADSDQSAVKKWSAGSTTVTNLISSGLHSPTGVAVDSAENVYIADTYNNAIYEVPHAFVDPTPKIEPVTVGCDALPAVLPSSANLTGPFAAASDSPWLTITGESEGVVTYAFTANTSAAPRTANITLLGQIIPVTQPGVIPPSLSNLTILRNGAFQFSFTNNQDAPFTVLMTTNLLLPASKWIVIGMCTNNGFGQYQFTDPMANGCGSRFFRVRLP